MHWALKTVNMNIEVVGEQKKKLQNQELEEQRLFAYENAKVYKERAKIWQDKRLRRKQFYLD